MVYAVISKKNKGRVHILHPDGRTLCLQENNGLAPRKTYEHRPKGKRLCGICKKLASGEAHGQRIKRNQFAEPNLSVLMGELVR